MDAFHWIGVLVIALLLLWFAAKLAKGLWTCWLADVVGCGYRWQSGPDCWAVVTGGTDGIGLEYARQLSRKGLNLLLISRSADKLAQVQKEISASSPREVRVLAADFTRQDIYEKIGEELNRLPHIEALVNNVGISYCTPEYYSQLESTNSPTFLTDLLNVNILSVARMTKLVLPKMETQKRGVVVNISSFSAVYPTPLLTLYAASKIFVDMFSRSLNAEYTGRGILVQCVLPAYVVTKMSKIKKPTLMVPTAEAYVRAALKTVGLESRTYGYWSHKLQGFVTDHLLNGIFGPGVIVMIAKKQLTAIHKSYYRKYRSNKAD